MKGEAVAFFEFDAFMLKSFIAYRKVGDIEEWVHIKYATQKNLREVVGLFLV